MKAFLRTILSVSLAIALLFSCVVTAGAARYLRGDADLNGVVDITDATTIQRYQVRMIDLSDLALKAADADGDGKVSIIDATWIQRWELQMKTPEGIGEAFDDCAYNYSLNARLLKGTPGVYEVKAVVPITPDPNNPTKTEERRQLSEPYPSVINRDDGAVIINNGNVSETSVRVLSNGVLGDLTNLSEIEI